MANAWSWNCSSACRCHKASCDASRVAHSRSALQRFQSTLTSNDSESTVSTSTPPREDTSGNGVVPTLPELVALRQAVAEVIGLTGHAASEDALRTATRDADRAVAEAARQALTRIRSLPDGVRVH